MSISLSLSVCLCLCLPRSLSHTHTLKTTHVFCQFVALRAMVTMGIAPLKIKFFIININISICFSEPGRCGRQGHTSLPRPVASQPRSGQRLLEVQPVPHPGDGQGHCGGHGLHGRWKGIPYMYVCVRACVCVMTVVCRLAH